ncbi:bifunctional TH2 protein, mitochondrial-like [Iris pallida]|uniref:Bifunctional TH2 protein, mitochondrial-like n=1 Tax=Iris pallida TaxID=29817 RepID=A0AAX6EHN0_IRIPA|nr:bifunctional TH2 protein, mitochondrial-like [Iris pallida]
MMAPVEEEGSAAMRFWERSKKEALLAAYTPFVVCLAAGNLDLEAFRRYIAQDAHFLQGFTKAYEMTAEYVVDDDDKAAILDLRKATLEELKLHISVAKDWGVDPEKEIVPKPATVKYINFLLSTAQGKFEGGRSAGKIVTPFEKTKFAAHALGAMTPCMRLYSYLGKYIESLLPHLDNHPYKTWIDNYSSDAFEAETVQIEELLDKLSVALTGEELDFIEKLYHQAMKLETEFFAAQPITQPAVVPLMKLHDRTKRLFVFSDFDLTCTVVDSCAILAKLAILTASKADHEGDHNLVDVRKTSSNLRNFWEALSRQYTEEYEKIIDDLLPKEAKEFDYDGLYKSLEVLSSFEKHANSRVVESGMLRGLNLDDIKRAGGRLKFRDGCSNFFQNIIKKKETMSVEFHVLSYCWCADLIRSAFSAVGCLNELAIHSNEFNFEDSVSTGEIVIKMESPLNKVEAFMNIVNEQSSEKMSVYIGDSVGDLLCLLKADVGIVVGSSESLRKVGKQFGVSFVPLYPALITKQRQFVEKDAIVWKGLSGVLYTASSWTEIQAFLLGV